MSQSPHFAKSPSPQVAAFVVLRHVTFCLFIKFTIHSSVHSFIIHFAFFFPFPILFSHLLITNTNESKVKSTTFYKYFKHIPLIFNLIQSVIQWFVDLTVLKNATEKVFELATSQRDKIIENINNLISEGNSEHVYGIMSAVVNRWVFEILTYM